MTDFLKELEQRAQKGQASITLKYLEPGEQTQIAGIWENNTRLRLIAKRYANGNIGALLIREYKLPATLREKDT